MKKIIIFVGALVAMTQTSYSCPNIQGSYNCHYKVGFIHSNVYTFKITRENNTYDYEGSKVEATGQELLMQVIPKMAVEKGVVEVNYTATCNSSTDSTLLIRSRKNNKSKEAIYEVLANTNDDGANITGRATSKSSFIKFSATFSCTRI